MILRQTAAELFDSLVAGPVLRTYTQCSTAFLQPMEGAGHVISGVCMSRTVPDMCVQFRDPHLNCSGEIRRS